MTEVLSNVSTEVDSRTKLSLLSVLYSVSYSVSFDIKKIKAHTRGADYCRGVVKATGRKSIIENRFVTTTYRCDRRELVGRFVAFQNNVTQVLHRQFCMALGSIILLLVNGAEKDASESDCMVS